MRCKVVSLLVVLSVVLAGCGTPNYPLLETANQAIEGTQYHIGPGDQIEVVVWRNPDVSQSVIVRPDGKVSLPLVNDVDAAGLTPMQLSESLEAAFQEYIKEPHVTVMLSRFVGTYDDTIRVVGEAAQPQSLAYRDGMSVLDVMIQVGGLTDFAAGNRSVLIRQYHGEKQSYRVRLDALVRDGDITANAPVAPGDILIIPEAMI